MVFSLLLQRKTQTNLPEPANIHGGDRAHRSLAAWVEAQLRRQLLQGASDYAHRAKDWGNNSQSFWAGHGCKESH